MEYIKIVVTLSFQKCHFEEEIPNPPLRVAKRKSGVCAYILDMGNNRFLEVGVRYGPGPVFSSYQKEVPVPSPTSLSYEGFIPFQKDDTGRYPYLMKVR